MQADKTTINDLSIFAHEEEQSVFHHINFTTTIGGKEWLHYFLSNPLATAEKVKETQQIIQRIIAVHDQWPQRISNGTVMVVGRFFETAVESLPSHPNKVNALMYKVTNASDYSITKYSVTHFVDFVQGFHLLYSLLYNEQNPSLLQNMLERVQQLLQRPEMQFMLQHDKTNPLSKTKILSLGHFIRNHFKQQSIELIDIYSRLDAYYSMATACKKYNYCFPVFIESNQPQLIAQQLYHPLLHTPIAYNIDLNQQQNFLFLTGANMAGKSTFIKAVGLSVYLASIGMGVPAQSMQLTMFDGLLSNIQVVDNIIQGESYFFNEVQRIRKTIEKISDGKKWLILIDELFKGTNVQDAMKCSATVIEGLRKMQSALFVLSTHLYEIGEGLQQYPNIQFRYFETEVKDEQLIFSYQLKEGISNDRLGYLILKREGVMEMLSKL
jgi:DNA mismatch repair ATPase MutS